MADDKNDGLEEGSDAKSSVGDIFGVSAGKKKKKKKKPKAEIVTAEQLAADDSVPFPDPADESDELDEPRLALERVNEETDGSVDQEAPTKVAPTPKKAKKKADAALAGVLLPSDDDAPASAGASDDYLNSGDLGDYDAPKSKTVPVLVGVIVVLLLVIIGGAVVATGNGDDIMALFKGELREKRIAEARMLEDQHKADQLANLKKFGNLMITGQPQYALVKLNGEVQYGRTSQGWREVRVGTSAGVQDLDIKKTHVVEFSAPGFDPTSVEVTEGKWQASAAGFSHNAAATLMPSSIHQKQEFDARLGEDVENEFFGKITINSMPSGAKIVFNNAPLLNEKGEELVTPATFDKYWVKNEESGKLEEKPVKVDTALDVGHKIQVFMEYESTCPESATPIACGKVDNCCPGDCTVATDSDCKWPAYITSLTRPMWTCTWNTDDGQPPEKMPKDKTIQHFCDYTFALDVDFNGLKSYIVKREEERQRILDQIKAEGADGPDAGTAPAEGEQAAAAP